MPSVQFYYTISCNGDGSAKVRDLAAQKLPSKNIYVRDW
jgi:hypothetical protein